MKARMSIMKTGEAALSIRGGDQTAPAGGGNMNSSFSAMNSSLSAKWMSKKSQILSVKDPASGSSQMSTTMAAGFGQQQYNLNT